MARVAKALGALQVSRITQPGYHTVGTVPGLYLNVNDTGARSWILRMIVGSKRRDIGLGGYPGVTLAMAHEYAREARKQVKEGVDPIEQRRSIKSALKADQSNALTFEQCAVAYIAAKESEWKNRKHAAQWSATLQTYAYPVMGRLLVRDIEQSHVLKVLEPIWHTKTETATRLRGRIECVLAFAVARGYRQGLNPARWKGHLDTMLPKPSKVAKVAHHTAVPVSKVGAFMLALRGQSGIGAKALEFSILTVARSGEVRGATWAEMDLDERTWVIPPARMKMGKEHRVPLSDSAITLLKSLPRIVGDEFVFPAPGGGPLSDMTLRAVMRRMNVDAVPHGFRSTFRDWASERTNYPRDVAEMALAHAIGSAVEAAYRRGDLFNKRRRMMADWAVFVGTSETKAKVIPINKSRASR